MVDRGHGVRLQGGRSVSPPRPRRSADGSGGATVAVDELVRESEGSAVGGIERALIDLFLGLFAGGGAQLALRADVSVERHRPDAELPAQRGHRRVAVRHRGLGQPHRRHVCAAGAAAGRRGSVVGLVVSLATARFIEALLFDVAPLDPVVLGGSAVVVLGLGAVACLVPAARALRAPPARTLNAD